MMTNLSCVRTDGFYLCKGDLYKGIGLRREFWLSRFDAHPTLPFRAYGRMVSHAEKADVVSFGAAAINGDKKLLTTRALGVN
jgi:hypothetical protein